MDTKNKKLEDLTGMLLTASARDYAESQGKILSDYNLVGIQSSTPDEIVEKRVKNLFYFAPENTEVIADYRIAMAFVQHNHDDPVYPFVEYVQFGTALVPKEEKADPYHKPVHHR